MRRARWVSDGSADGATNGAKGGPGGSGTRPPSTRRRPHGRHDARGPVRRRVPTVPVCRSDPWTIGEPHLPRRRCSRSRQLAGVHSLNPTTAEDILAGIFRRDGAQSSATSTRRILGAPATQLRDAVLRYQDALGPRGGPRARPSTARRPRPSRRAAPQRAHHQPTYPTLRSRLALRALDGQNPTRTPPVRRIA
jgi:hypothetical protein